MKRRNLLQAMGLLPVASTLPHPGAAAEDQGGRAAGLAAKVALYGGRATLFIDDQPVYPMLYALTDTPGGRWTWEEICRENLENFRDAGVKLIQVDIWMEYIWSADGRLDIDLVRRQIRG